MKSINRWLYGPTPEERVREWRRKLRQNQREVDREIANVRAA
jgi:charged multivesicular body protein 3